MEKQLMLQALEEKADAYRQDHPTTADADIRMFRAFCAGKSAVQIAMDTPCAESTVYRAIRRVKEFLQPPDMDAFLEVLGRQVSAHAPNFGEWNAQSVLELVYVAYSEFNRFESPESNASFDRLYEELDDLPLKPLDRIIDIVCDMIHYHERDGFTEGLKLGVRLGNELRMECTQNGAN